MLEKSRGDALAHAAGVDQRPALLLLRLHRSRLHRVVGGGATKEPLRDGGPPDQPETFTGRSLAQGLGWLLKKQ